jgi:hypothetical protein
MNAVSMPFHVGHPENDITFAKLFSVWKLKSLNVMKTGWESPITAFFNTRNQTGATSFPVYIITYYIFQSR